MNPRVVACAIAFATLLAGLASAQAPASQPSPSSPAVQPTPTPSGHEFASYSLFLSLQTVCRVGAVAFGLLR